MFLVKALFGVTRSTRARDFEVTPETEPELFRFLYRLADETRAPRPHRVFLSPLVNAAVFYDRSFLNLLFPSKKNLELGLGLVNVLTLSDLKAVLAHEFQGRAPPALGPLPPDLLHYSQETAELVSLETGQGVPEGASKAYMHLAKGALTEALRVSDGNTEERLRVVILAAASDGATPEMVKMALALPAEFTTETTVWSALALATRERKNSAALVSRAKEIDDSDAESLVAHLQQPGFFENAVAVRSAAVELNPLAGAQLYVMGSILKGNAAPPEWRRLASGLLFASERPFFDL